MQVSVARRVEPRATGELAALALLGFGAGIAAGFLLSEVFGAGGHRRMGRLLSRRKPGSASAATAAALLTRVREALAAETTLAAEPIELRLRGGSRGAELSGWVTTRQARSLAYRVAREALGGALELRNHLLVRGEDDRASGREDAPRSA